MVKVKEGPISVTLFFHHSGDEAVVAVADGGTYHVDTWGGRSWLVEFTPGGFVWSPASFEGEANSWPESMHDALVAVVEHMESRGLEPQLT